jgi:hypothetical protein
VKSQNKSPNREETLLGRPFFDMILEVFAPPFPKVEKERDNAINPASQPDSKTVKNGAD